MMTFDAFISYSHKDKATADATCAALEAAGIRCWIAPRDIMPGDEWGAAIVEAIDQCRVMIVVFSSSANESRQIRREVERAVSRGITVMPLRVEDVMPTKALEYFMSSLHWLDALTPPLEKHLARLAQAVKMHLEIEGEPLPEPHIHGTTHTLDQPPPVALAAPTPPPVPPPPPPVEPAPMQGVPPVSPAPAHAAPPPPQAPPPAAAPVWNAQGADAKPPPLVPTIQYHAKAFAAQIARNAAAIWQDFIAFLRVAIPKLTGHARNAAETAQTRARAMAAQLKPAERPLQRSAESPGTAPPVPVTGPAGPITASEPAAPAGAPAGPAGPPPGLPQGRLKDGPATTRRGLAIAGGIALGLAVLVIIAYNAGPGPTSPPASPPNVTKGPPASPPNVTKGPPASSPPAGNVTFTFRARSEYPYKVQLKFYSQTRSHVWPSRDEAWDLNDDDVHTFRLICMNGEKICFGAWPTGHTTPYWGVGADNKSSCTSCCWICGQGDPATQVLERP